MKKAVACALTAVVLAGAAADFAVKPGDDLARARDEARRALKEGRRVCVTLEPGIYTLAAPLKFEADDSGTEEAPVVWRAAKPGATILRGGVTLKAANLKPVSDPSVKARFPAEVREQVREADLSSAYPKPLTEWEPVFRGLPPDPWAYSGGKPLPLARWPNEGTNDLTGPEPHENGWCWFTNVVDSGRNPDAQGRARETAVRPGAIRFMDPRAERWRIADGAWMYGYWVHDWFDVYQRIGSFDPSTRTVRFAEKVHFGVGGRTWGGSKRRYIVINLPEELDAPGEWWLDRQTRRFYILPAVGMDEIVLARAQSLISVSGAKNMRFEGLTLQYTHGGDGAYVCIDGENVVAYRCAFTDHGGKAVVVGGGFGNRVEECRIARTGDTAIHLYGGDRNMLVPARNALVRCDVSRWGGLSKSAGVMVQGCGNAVRGCTLHDAPTGAIRYDGNEHLFADNDIHHAMQEACDAGAIYTGRDASTQGHLIFGNRLHDLGDTPELSRFRNGLYFDDSDWGDAAIGNSVVGVGNAVVIGGGSMHPIFNNVLADCYGGVYLDDRAYLWKRSWRGSFAPDPKTGLGWAESCCAPFNYRYAPWSVAYPDLLRWMDDNPELPHANVVSNNVFVRCSKPYRLWQRDVEHNGLLHSDWNVVTTNKDAAIPAPFHPVEIAAAVRTAVSSPDGTTEAQFGLDVAGRLSWRMKHSGREMVAVSTLGVTVDGRDFGKLVVPGIAIRSEGTGVAVTNVFSRPSQDTRFTDKLPQGWRGVAIPLADLVTGRTVAVVEARVFTGGAAYRWHVPRSGSSCVSGEMNSWVLPRRDAVHLLEAERPAGYPYAELQPRGKVAVGVVFPERPRGFPMTGKVVTPWRVTYVK